VNAALSIFGVFVVHGACAAAQSVAQNSAQETAPNTTSSAQLAVTELTLPNDGSRLALRDLDGDGDQELLRFDETGVAVRLLGADGVFASAESLLPWPSTRVAWDLVDLDGDGRVQLATITDGRRVELRTWSPPTDPNTPGAWAAPELLLEEACFLPYGVSRVGLARDVDGDGLADLVLPGAGVFRVRISRGRNANTASLSSDGSPPNVLTFAAPIEVAFEPDVQLALGDPDQLTSTFAQTVRVPWFRIEDVDGDGLQDLVSETSDRIAFHLARPTIATLPTWTLDLAALRGEAPAANFDLDDILAAVSGTAQWRVADLDGVLPKDLVIGAQGTFKVYLGGAATGPRADADQVLKASGNVLYFFLRQVLGDERPDLQILRGERLSLAKLLRFLVLPGRIDFELFTYQNSAGVFDRKPTQRNVLALRVPRLLGFLEEVESLGDELEAKWKIPARRVAWDADAVANDVIDVRPWTGDGDGGYELVLLRDCAGAPQRFEDLPTTDIDKLVERLLLADLDRAGDGAETVIDLGELDQFALSPSSALRDRSLATTPSVRAMLPFGPLDWSLRTPDIDGDGRADVLVVGEVMDLVDEGGEFAFEKKGVWSIAIFVRR